MAINVINNTKSVANQFLLELRDKSIQLDRAKFKNNLKRLGFVMAYEISKTMTYQTHDVETSLGQASIEVIIDSPVLIGVMRAAMPFLQGINEVFDQSDVGFIGAYRDETTDNLSIKLDYSAIPEITGRNVILADPMLATGKSMVDVVNKLIFNNEPKNLHLVSAVAAPEGIDYISKNLTTDYTIWTGAIDEGLNDKSYIVPGLGDAGDLSFGPKV